MKNQVPAFAIAAALLAGCATTATMQPAPMVQAVAASAPRAAGKTEVLWLGHATVRITTPGGKVLVIDPWLGGNPKTPAAFKPLAALGKVDLILVTHAHPDHFTDAPALGQLNKAKMVVPSDFGYTLLALGMVPEDGMIRLHKGASVMPFGDGGLKITGVHAEHSSQMRFKNASTGKDEVWPGGEPMGYIIELENGFKIWHTGDTAVFGDMQLIGRTYRPDLVMASIDGAFTMNPVDAALAMTEMVKPKYVMPIHFGTLPIMQGTAADFKAALGRSPVQMLVIDPGQKVEF